MSSPPRRSLRARPAPTPAPARRQPTARQLENREMQRRRRETPIAEANRVYRIIRRQGNMHNTYDNAVESYNNSASNVRSQLNRLTNTSPMRKYYQTLAHKLHQGRTSFINSTRKRFPPKTNMSAAHLNAVLRAMAKNANWSNLTNKDPISLANVSNWPGNLAFRVKRGNQTNYFTVPSFVGYFGMNWNKKAVMNKGHPLTRGTVERKNINVVRFKGNKP